MTEIVLIDEAIGETRACLFDEQGQAVELLIERWSERETRVTEGSQHQGRVVKVDVGLNAAFVEMPMGEAGFLPFGKKGRPAAIHEGAKIPVQVSREALSGKGPNLILLPDDAEIAVAPSLVQRMYLPDGVPIVQADREGREQIDASIDQALGKLVTIPGGGNIAIEQTRNENPIVFFASVHGLAPLQMPGATRWGDTVGRMANPIRPVPQASRRLYCTM